jgi:hypothetical protein
MAPVADRETMIQVIDAVEECTPRGSFSSVSKRERAGALRAAMDDLFTRELPSGSKALMIDRGFAGIAGFMVPGYTQHAPRPIPTY